MLFSENNGAAECKTPTAVVTKCAKSEQAHTRANFSMDKGGGHMTPLCRYGSIGNCYLLGEGVSSRPLNIWAE